MRRGAFWAIGLALAVVAFAYRYLSFSHFSNDHFLHLSIAQQITRGELPVRDFVERGFPLTSMLSAAGQLALGTGLHSELLLISGAFAAATLLAFVAAARLTRSLTIALAAAVMTLLAFPATYGYPKVLAYAAAFAAAAGYCVRPTWPRLAVLAGATVFAFLLRHDHGVLLTVGVAVLLIVRHGWTRQGTVSLLRFAALAALLALPYLSWVAVYDDVARYFVDGYAFSLREAQRSVWWTPPSLAIDRGRPLFAKTHEPAVNVRWSTELTPAQISAAESRHSLVRLAEAGPRSWRYTLTQWSSSDIRALVGDPAVEDTHGIDRSAYRLEVPAPGVLSAMVGHYRPAEGLRLRINSIAVMFYVVWLVPILAVIWVIVGWSHLAIEVRALVLMAAAVQVVMNASMLRDPLDSRIRDVVMPVSLLLAFLAVALGRGGRTLPRRVFRVAVAALVLAVPLTATAAIGQVNEHLADMRFALGRQGLAARFEEIRRDLAPPQERTGRIHPDYQVIIEYLRACTPLQARLYVMSLSPEVFFYTGRSFASGQVALTPGYYVTERHAALMLERLARQDVPFVIMDAEIKDELPVHYPRVVSHVRSRYREIASLPIGTGKHFILFAEHDRPVRGTFGPLALPCYVEAAPSSHASR